MRGGGLHVVRVGDVDPARLGPPARRDDLLRDRLPAVGVPLGDEHRRACRGDPEGMGAADALPGPGHHDDAVLENPAHRGSGFPRVSGPTISENTSPST